MIKPFLFILLFMLQVACKFEANKGGAKEHPTPTANIIYPADSTAANISALNYADSLNYTDTNGWKQGKWIKTGWKDKVIAVKTYRNDTLHGEVKKLDGMPHTGNYVMGKREGYQYTYYTNPTRLFIVSFYEKDSLVWTGFPAANEHILTPVKHFQSARDSVYIRAPYENGNIWYEGAFCLKPSKMNKGRTMTYCYGVHTLYHRNGKIKGIVDYEQEIIEEFDSLGNRLYQTHFKDRETHNQPLPNY